MMLSLSPMTNSISSSKTFTRVRRSLGITALWVSRSRRLTPSARLTSNTMLTTEKKICSGNTPCNAAGNRSYQVNG